MTSILPADDAPRVIVFAGPNGTGKSTHTDAILDVLGIGIFVNADIIARGRSGAHTDICASASSYALQAKGTLKQIHVGGWAVRRVHGHVNLANVNRSFPTHRLSPRLVFD